ncbi:MAG: hypothetical protein KGJ10_08800, partial [Acidobacteriota bacterium]|nr:hypothetical protein [Acidobacteriota bacterium]
LVVSSSGQVTTSGALAPGSYVTRGTTSDANGDQGKFFFNLIVSATTTTTTTTVATPLNQGPPVRASLNADASSSFSTQLVILGVIGPVTFTQTTGAPSLVVSSSGLVTTSGALAPGSYVTRGTTSDANGDRGKFFFNLIVRAATTTTTSTTSTTTATTAPPITLPAAFVVIGHAVAGRTVPLTITGLGFYGRPKVTSHAGTSVVVTRDTGSALYVRVYVRPGSRNGVFTFTLTFAGGQICHVRYVQRS